MLTNARQKNQPLSVLVEPLINDAAEHLADQLSEVLGKPVQVRILKGWDFVEDNVEITEKILQNGLLANPNAHQLFMAYPDFY